MHCTISVQCPGSSTAGARLACGAGLQPSLLLSRLFLAPVSALMLSRDKTGIIDVIKYTLGPRQSVWQPEPLSSSVEADTGPPINSMQVGSQPLDPGKGLWALGVLPLAPDIVEKGWQKGCLGLDSLGTLLSFTVFGEMGMVPV